MRSIKSLEEWSGAGPDIGLFIGGCTHCCVDWQEEITSKLSFTNLTLLNPRGSYSEDTIKWRHRHLIRADAILFWFPAAELEAICSPCLYEYGLWNFRPKKIFVGCHPKSDFVLEVETYSKLERVGQVVASNLDDLAAQVAEWAARKKKDHFVRDPEQPSGVCLHCLK